MGTKSSESAGTQAPEVGLKSEGTPSQAGPGFQDVYKSALRRTFYGVGAGISLTAAAIAVTGWS